MANHNPRHYGGYAGGYDIMPNERLMNHCLLFTAPKPLLYDFIMANLDGSMNIPLASGSRETYCLNVATGMNGAEAARHAGYCRKHPENARVMSWYLLKRQDVRDRIAWLRAQATDDAVLTLIEIKQVLSEIARANLKDYQDSNGRFRPLDENAPNPSAVAEVIYKFDPIKRQPYVASLHLRDPIPAIVELCRLDGAYKKPVSGVTVAPVTSVSMDQARAKLSARLEAVVKRLRSGAVESGDIDSLVEDGCSEEQHSKDLEV